MTTSKKLDPNTSHPGTKELLPSHPGPKTPQGKQRSRYNAMGLGIFANLVLTGEPHGESAQDYRKLVSALRKAILPANALEDVLVEKLAFELLRAARICQADMRVAPLMFEKILEHLEKNDSPVIRASIFKGDEVAFLRKDPPPDLLLRYDISVDRKIGRLSEQLERLQRTRMGQPLPPLVKVQVDGG